MSGLYTISGCSGGGKSSLLAVLAKNGVITVEEPGMRIIRAGGPLPWEDMESFLLAARDMATRDFEKARSLNAPVVFDRGLPDALSGLAALGKEWAARELTDLAELYSAAFYAPPWPEIFEQTDFRPHDFASAKAEAERILADLQKARFNLSVLPKATLEERSRFILDRIEADAP